MKSIFIITFCALIVAFLNNSDNRSEDLSKTRVKGQASLFLNYAAAFDDYFEAHKNATGDLSKKVTLPNWLPIEPTIKMYGNAGTGYVFMPNTSGLLAEIQERTSYSSLLGLTDQSNIITINGKINKPSFIPAGSIVYVR